MNENIRTILFGKYKKQISSIRDLFKNSGYFDNLMVDIDEQPDDPITSTENSEDLTNLEPDQPNENIDSEINENENFQKLLKEVDMEG